MKKIRIGTRGSKLALKQASLVRDALSEAGYGTEIVTIHTKGDRIQDKPLWQIGDKGVFASELEQALKEGEIDLAVHSAKDLPMELEKGLVIAAVLKRADVRDVLVVPKGGALPSVRLPVCGEREANRGEAAPGKAVLVRGEPGAGGVFRVGTGSRRRQTLAGQLWENVVCENIRGNVDTRLRKLKEGAGGEPGAALYDGILLAKAGLDRLDIRSRYAEEYEFYPLSPEDFLPAACQGIIAVEAVRDSAAAAVCEEITDEETALCFLVEREALSLLSADCSEAAAAWCRLEIGEESRDASGADRLLLDVMYAGRRVGLTGAVSAEEGRRLARQAARIVKKR